MDDSTKFLAIVGEVINGESSDLEEKLDIPIRDVGLTSLKLLVLMSMLEISVGRKVFDARTVRSVRTLRDLLALQCASGGTPLSRSTCVES